MARPKIEINLEELEKLARLQCTYAEIAAFFDCSIDTIKRRMKDEEFCTTYKKGLEEGKASLRRMQWKAAQGGNATMLIWLGKQYLGQSDKRDLEHTGDVPIRVVFRNENGNGTRSNT